MAQILVAAMSNDRYTANPDKDRMCFKRGMPVEVKEDSHVWGRLECLPRFVVIKIPLISPGRLLEYIKQQDLLVDPTIVYRVREWQIRWDDLPQGAKDKLRDTGQLTIKATDAYTGPYDYTWSQVKGFFHNLLTGEDETEELI